MQDTQERRDWHAFPWDDVWSALDARPEGLTTAEARTRLELYGPNRLPHDPPPAWWRIVLRQFQSPLIYILAIAAVASLATGHATDAAFIGAVLGLNAVIGGYQEWKAQQTALALQQLLSLRASVVRDGEVSEIDAEGVVPGDVVWLESGNRVAADVRLLSAHGLEVDESLLTGESMAVLKDFAWQGDDSTPIGDRLNMAYAGSVVARGRAKGMVVATGTATSVGELALDVMRATGGKPPLLVRMERFTQVIAVTVLVAAIAVGIMGVVAQGYGWTEMFLFGVALAVSAIPEGLPISLTVALAIATTRMARRGVVVRQLTAVEGLGSCTLIATDKTGTLTCNELTVRELRLPDGTVYMASGQGFAPNGEVLQQGSPIDPGDHGQLQHLARAAVLCNEADLHRHDQGWIWRGDAVDVAFLSLGHKLGYSREKSLELHPQVNEIPFEPERQFAASFHATDGETRVFVKGAPERVLAMSDLPPEEARRQASLAEAMAREGYRVLALAEGTFAERVDSRQTPPLPDKLRLLGFAGMIDPLRSGVKEAVAACRKAGVRVSMVTGDHRVTALAIARELGMAASEEEVVTGEELADKPPEALREMVQRASVFARVAPQQKLQIVEAARLAGHFVAVTGDGVNDAPALRNANIGVAMGKSGTDVAREAAELVITDDNFATIVAGIEEGRVAYDNVRKVIYLLISTGAAEIVLIGLCVLTGMPLPLLPVQLLWLNLVTNGIQDVALAFEPGEGDVLRRPPRAPNERIFNRLMIERTVVAAVVIGFVAFGTFYWLRQLDVPEASARNIVLLLMVLFENVHIGNCRSETKSAFKLSPLRSPILLSGAVLAFSLHVLMMYLPFGNTVLRTEPVDLRTWLVLIGLALSILVAMELHKLSWAMRQRSQAT